MTDEVPIPPPSPEDDPITILAICGAAQSGKDTAARALTLYRGYHRIALADGVKSALADLGDDMLKELGQSRETIRWAWQTLGTEAREDVQAPQLWVSLLLAKVCYLAHYHPRPRCRFVVPDLRFPAELRHLKVQGRRWGAKVACLKLVRGGPAIAESAHSSETSVADVPADMTYANNGTIEDLVSVALRFAAAHDTGVLDAEQDGVREVHQ